ncbi:DUF6297 family protein [Nocardioides campestrisoli]|uniref:DUF6297 family protein n=1 Tax=Nocardioides campestrisoli TaxID=2736757 RepID=UPI0015E69E67|nr:DUF6297 family protein [Nocardioides campestrisoli]
MTSLDATRDRGGDDVAAREAARALAVARSRASEAGERFADLYVWIFSTALITVWILSFARETFTGRTCSAGACAVQDHPAYAALAVVCLGLGALLLALGAAGPVSAERATARWLLTTTADRAVLLRGPFGAAVTGGAFGGVVVGLLAAMAAQGGGLEPAPLAAGAALGAVVGALVPLALLPAQTARPWGRAPGTLPAGVLGGVGLALLSWVLLGGAGLPESPALTADRVVAAAWVAAGVLALVLVAGLALTLRTAGRLAELSDAQLARGREVVDAVADSALMLDASALTGLQRRRADQRRGRHPSRPLHGRGGFAFLVADARQVRRRWRSVAVTFLAVPFVLVAGEGFGYGAAILAATAVVAWAGRQAGAGLRTWLGSRGLRRSVRSAPWTVTLALTAAPTLACALVAVPAVLLVDGPWWGGVHLAVAGLAATMRAADPPPVELGAVISTPAGALPTGLIFSVLHGPDLALLLGLALVLVGDPYVVVTALAALGRQVVKER